MVVDTATISLEQARADFPSVLAQIPFGKTATIVGANDEPIAVLVSLRRDTTVPVVIRGMDPLERIEGTRTGNTITVFGSGGPLAVMVSLLPSPPKMPFEEWSRQWDELTEKVSRAWIGNESAVETIAEMRQ